MLELYEQNGVEVSINDLDIEYKFNVNVGNFSNEVEAMLSLNGVDVLVGTGRTYVRIK